jgi:hypothetical protein
MSDLSLGPAEAGHYEWAWRKPDTANSRTQAAGSSDAILDAHDVHFTP